MGVGHGVERVLSSMRPVLAAWGVSKQPHEGRAVEHLLSFYCVPKSLYRLSYIVFITRFMEGILILIL